MHAGASEGRKIWPEERFAAAGKELRKLLGGTIIIIGGPQEAAASRRIAVSLGPPVRNLAGLASIPAMGAVISRLSLLLTNDSGPAHIAYALTIPSVTLFGKTDPREWGPPDCAHHRVLRGPDKTTASIPVEKVVRTGIEARASRQVSTGGLTMNTKFVHDCIIIGAGPGGLQAAIYLGRFRRRVLLIDRGGGRTAHAKSIENFLTQKAIPGNKIIELGMEQAESFGVEIRKGLVTSVLKKEAFEVSAEEKLFHSKFIIVSSGVYDNIPSLENVHKFFGTSFFTCVDCDGYKTIDKKIIVLGNTIESVRLSFAIHELYTREITLILYFGSSTV